MNVPHQRRNRLRGAILGSLLATSTVAVAATSTTGASAADEPKVGGELVVAIGGELLTADPSKGSANTMALIGYAIYDTLMIVPHIGDVPQPNLAESLVESDDQMSWTLTLRPDVKFSDDTPLDAEAVKYNLDRNRAPGSSAAALLSSIDSVEVVDELTVQINMKEPFANLPYVFSYDGSGTAGYVASPTALEEYGDDYTAHAAGAGPYVLTHWAPGEPMELERNPNYWNAANRDVYLDKVTVRVIADPQSAYQAIAAGDVDLFGTASTPVLRSAANDASVRVVQGVDGSQDSIIVNTAKAPFDDQRVRTALSMALDREELAALTTEGFGEPAVSLFPATHPYASDNANPGFDLDAAKALLEEYTAETGNPASFTFTCNNARTQGEVITAQLAEAGFDVQLDSVESAAWVGAFFDQKFDAICWTMAGFLTPDLLPYRFLHSTGDLNKGSYASEAFDSFADQARTASDPNEQRELWVQADAVLVEELPWIWTVSAPNGFILSERVRSESYDDPTMLRYYVPTFNDVWLDS